MQGQCDGRVREIVPRVRGGMPMIENVVAHLAKRSKVKAA
jgi:hypothetical protein